MATYSDRVQKSVTLYEPGPLPEEVDDLGLYLVTELKRLGSILYNQATFRLQHPGNTFMRSVMKAANPYMVGGANSDFRTTA